MEERNRKPENGYGWRLKGSRRTAWLECLDGNSGFMMAYAALYECNHKAEYADKQQLLLRDMRILCTQRKPETGRDLRESPFRGKLHDAWCHGAPGILAFTNETGRAVS